ncbi:methionine synthase [Clostridium sp. MSJ-4]|uniref:Methionine synthase n=1 Tax=Clostridium simiarum TaxID=2841506 RepID=A0ABS6EZA5_9CLOT|nr:methionine synthase [Clostridium simiarum]MBU5591569.1 methionine synthase [Clostridium simiarum]
MEKLFIDKNEVLRYLGYRKQALDKNIEKLIDECINEIKILIKAKHVYKFFKVNKNNRKITLDNCSTVLESKDIYMHLDKADTCILMAVTLGGAVDTRIKYYEKLDMTKAVILDACANTAIEEVCDKLCVEIEESVEEKDKILTSRYSPGYGDLSLDMQPDFISLIDAHRTIGLTISSHNILTPRKSVTAIVGVVDKKYKTENKKCLGCNNYLSCNFRRDGERCGT